MSRAPHPLSSAACSSPPAPALPVQALTHFHSPSEDHADSFDQICSMACAEPIAETLKYFSDADTHLSGLVAKLPRKGC